MSEVMSELPLSDYCNCFPQPKFMLIDGPCPSCDKLLHPHVFNPRMRVLDLRDKLKDAIKMLKHYGPPHPEHFCNPETQCDSICAEYYEFDKAIYGFQELLEGWS